MPVAKHLLTLAVATILGSAAASMACADTLPAQPGLSGNSATLPGQGRIGELSENLKLLRQLRKNQQSSPDVVRPMIVGGENAAEGVHPFQVGLVFKDSYDDDFQDQFCGGTLVAERFVVTAAHCTERFTDPGSEVQVLVKARKLEGSGERVDVTRMYVHPNFNSQTYDYDVAVWELASPVTGVSFASLANLPPTTPGGTLRVTGWGTFKDVNKPEFPIALQQVDVPFVPVTDGHCGNVYDITPRMLCAGDTGIDSCYGDSGGPLTIDRGAGFTELVGIVSWGPFCAGPNLPGVYANVAESSINAFIRNVVSGNTRTIQFAGDVDVSEGARRVTLTLTRSSTAGVATVRFSTVARDAVAKSDFNAVSGTVTFRRGVSTATVSIPIVNDRKKEGWEKFSVVLSRPSTGWTFANNGRTDVFIQDDD